MTTTAINHTYRYGFASEYYMAKTYFVDYPEAPASTPAHPAL